MIRVPAFRSTTTSRLDEERRLVRLVQDRLTQGRNPALHAEWQLNLNFLEGQQWALKPTAPYEAESDAARPQAPSWRLQLTANHILANYMRLLSTLTASRPDLTIPTTSADPTDHARARAKLALVKALWRSLHLDDLYDQLAQWLIVTGNAFMKAYWDPRAGPLLPGEKDIHLGDVRVALLGPHELIPEPSALSLDQAMWVIHVQSRSPEWVKAHYGVTIRPKSEPANGRGLFQRSDSDKYRPTLQIAEMWERPTPDHPEGRLVTVIEDQLVEDRPMPDAELGLPFVHFRYIPLPNRFWGRGAISDVRSMQKHYNRLITRIGHNANLHASPPWLIPTGSVNPKTITDSPALRIMYNPMYGKPTREPPPDMPKFIDEATDRTLRDIDRIMGVTPISRSDIITNTPSGHAIAMLVEQQLARFLPTLHDIEQKTEQLANLLLRLAQKHYQEERLLEIKDDDGRIVHERVAPCDLQGNHCVVVRQGSTVPRSLAAEHAQILELWRERILTDREQVLELLAMASYRGQPTDLQLDIGQAQRENARLAAATPVAVESWHNHRAHIRVHNNFRKTTEYEALGERAKRVIAEHIAAHEAHLDATSDTFSLNGQGKSSTGDSRPIASDTMTLTEAWGGQT